MTISYGLLQMIEKMSEKSDTVRITPSLPSGQFFLCAGAHFRLTFFEVSFFFGSRRTKWHRHRLYKRDGRDVWIPLVGFGTRQYNDTSQTKQCVRHLLQEVHTVIMQLSALTVHRDVFQS